MWFFKSYMKNILLISINTPMHHRSVGVEIVDRAHGIFRFIDIRTA